MLHVVPVLAAEKSKAPFYICAGLLVAWAIILSVGLGLRRPEFPGGAAGQRAVIAVSFVLVAATMTTAVVTAEHPAPAQAAAAPSAAGASGRGSSLTESAAPNGDLRFTKDTLHASPGHVTISFTNMAPEMHNMTIALGTKVLAATPTFQGGTKVLSLNLKPGTYVFYCSVPGHRQAGMQGTLTVG